MNLSLLLTERLAERLAEALAESSSNNREVKNGEACGLVFLKCIMIAAHLSYLLEVISSTRFLSSGGKLNMIA